MKKLVAILLALVVLLSCIACTTANEAQTAAPAAPAAAASEKKADAAPAPAAAAEKRIVNVFTKKREWDWDAIEAAYEAANPDIDLVVDATDAQTYYDLLKGYLASGDLPDVIQVTSGDVLKNWGEYLVPLDDLDAFNVMSPDVVDEFVIEGKRFGVPLFSELHGVIYNMSYLNEAGWTKTPETIDEFVQMNEDLLAKGLPTGICPWNTGASILGHMCAAGVFSAEGDAYGYQDKLIAGEAKLTGDEYWEGLFDFLALTVKYGNPDALVTDNTTERNALYAEEYAWYAHDGSWLTPQIKANNPALEDHIALGVYPFSSDASKNKIGNSIQGISVMNTDHAEDAKAFVNWLTSSEEGCDIQVNKNAVVVLRADANLTTENVGALSVQGMEYVANGKSNANFRGIPASIQSGFSAALQKFVADTSDANRTAVFAEIEQLYSTCK